MDYILVLDDDRLLEQAGGRCLTGRFPHLRLLSLRSAATRAADDLAVPPHLAQRVFDAAVSPRQAHGILTADPEGARQRFPHFDERAFVTFERLEEAYTTWLHGSYLPFAATVAATTPEGLFPIGFDPPPVTLEVVGSCQAEFLVRAIAASSGQLPAATTTVLSLQNHPVVTPPPPGSAPSAVLALPPFRYLHPESLDDVVSACARPGYLETCRRTLRAWLDALAAARAHLPLFVGTFIEPVLSPDGAFFNERSPRELRHFIRSCNDEIVAWCATHQNAYVLDVDALAGLVGKRHVDESPVMPFGHRVPLDPYDDWVERDEPIATPGVLASFAVASDALYVAIVRQLEHQLITLSEAEQVKLVIVDLDNTLWRGTASDLHLGSWQGRPSGLVEALRILRRRGILVAIASKNDRSFIAEHFHALCNELADEPLGVPLSLEDFDALRMGFDAKSASIASILEELNLLEANAVFIDDNALEREEVQSAFPRLRILGAELTTVRRELLYSPFTLRHRRNAEDALRATTVKVRARLAEHERDGSAAGFLSSLGLTCAPVVARSADDPCFARATQLLNKTNQWSLNGARQSEAEMAQLLVQQRHLVALQVTDRSSEYGIVAVALVDPEHATVSQMAVSCRVVGMGIDHALVALLAERHGPLTYAFRATEANRAAQAFFSSIGGEVAPEGVTVTEARVPEHLHLHALEELEARVRAPAS